MLYDDFMPTRTIWVSTSGRDGNSGSEGSPVASITQALKLAQPGTAIMVKAGTYRENVNLNKSGTEDAPIAIISADGHQAASIVPADDGVRTIRGYGVDNIIIDGFDITGSSRDAIAITRAGSGSENLTTNIVIKNNYIHDAGGDGIKIAQGQNVYILDNVVTRTKGQGIDFVAVNDSVIAGNDVSHTPSNSLIMVKGGSARVQIHDNVAHDADPGKTTNGILIGGSTEKPYFLSGYNTQEAYDVVAFNNTVYNVERGIQFMGAVDSEAHGNHLYNVSGRNFDLSSSDVWHSPPMDSKNITIYENGVSKEGWLNVSSGQGSGFVEYGNVVGEPPNTSEPEPVNGAPVAADDMVSGVGTDGIEGNVLADNGTGPDTDPDGDPLTVTSVNGSAANVGVAVVLAGGGTVTIKADGSFVFDPNGAYATMTAGERAVEAVTYEVSDGRGGSDTATLTITVLGDPANTRDGAIVIEAEHFTGLADSAFVVESVEAASGGSVLRLPSGTNTGAVSTTVPEGTAPGVYDIVVRYFDEIDGAATSSLSVNGVEVDAWTWDADLGDVMPSANNATARSISGVTLAEGDVLTFTGSRDMGEWVRLDALELVPVDVQQPEPEPQPEPEAPISLLIEAESFTGLADSQFVVEANADASGGNLIRLPSGTNSGSVSTVLADDLAPGTYDIVIRYFDESDGQTQSAVSLDGAELDAWTWDADLGDVIASAATATTRTISGVTLNGGETLTFSGSRDIGEWARLDAIELVPVDVAPVIDEEEEPSDPIIVDGPDTGEEDPTQGETDQDFWDEFLARTNGEETYTVTLADGRTMVVSTTVISDPALDDGTTTSSVDGDGVWL